VTDEQEIDRDEPGAPPGFLLDKLADGDGFDGHMRVEVEVEIDTEADRLAQGAGEVEDDAA